MEPIEAFPLIECTVEQTQGHAEIRKAAPTGSDTWRWAARDAEVDAKHHQGRDDRRGPENPVPREVVCIPSLKCRSDVARKDDVGSVGGNAENDETFRERRQYEGQGQ